MIATKLTNATRAAVQRRGFASTSEVGKWANQTTSLSQRRGVGYTLMTMAIGVPLIVYFHSTASSAQFQKAHKHSGGLGKRNLDGKKSE